MYAVGLGTLVEQIPHIKDCYMINVEKLKTNILANKLFCDSLAIKIGSRMIKQMGEIFCYALWRIFSDNDLG